MKLPVSYIDIEQKKPLIIKLSDNTEYVSLFLRSKEYGEFETRMRTYMTAFETVLDKKSKIAEALLTAKSNDKRLLQNAMMTVNVNYRRIYTAMIDLIARASIFYPSKMKYIEDRLRVKHDDDLEYIIRNYKVKKTPYWKVRRDLIEALNKDVDLCFDVFEKLLDYNKPYVKKKLKALQMGTTSSRPTQRRHYTIVSVNADGQEKRFMKPILPKSSST